MKTMEIRYNDNNYILKEVNVHGTDVKVGTEELEKALIDDDEYTSKEAKHIDEMIYCYVDQNRFRDDPDKLAEYVETYFD